MATKHVRRQRVVADFETVGLGDPRRDHRALAIAGRLATQPEASLPEAMGGDAELEGLYRHLGNPEISLEQLLRPHVERTVARVKEAGCAYAISDTTGCTFGGDVRREGLGPVNCRGDQGFRAHATLAVALGGSRCPLGLLAIGTRVRVGEKPKGHNEADRWSQAMNVVESHFRPGQLIHLADRESDIFELMAEARMRDWRFIFRATYDRSLVPEPDGGIRITRLYAAVNEQPPRFQVDVPLSARPRGKRPTKQRAAFPVREGRLAELCFSAMTVKLKRPDGSAARGRGKWVEVNVVRAWEPEPPAGEAPVEWLLYTSEPIATEKEIRAVVEGYRTRWVIEEYFKALKTGCAYESRQLESAHALFNLFAYCLVVAYALLLMRTLARAKKNSPATDVLSTTQLKCLRLLSRGKLEQRPTAREALLRTAALGGHIKNNGEPGWRTLSRGWQKLLAAEEILDLAQAAREL